MTSHETLQPPGWPRPRGYSNGIAASGRIVATAGVVGWDTEEKFPSDTVAGQFRQALDNVLAILAEGGTGPEHIVRMTCYVTDMDGYRDSLTEIGSAWRDTIGRNFPAMALIGVSELVEREAKVEIECLAIVPE